MFSSIFLVGYLTLSIITSFCINIRLNNLSKKKKKKKKKKEKKKKPLSSSLKIREKRDLFSL